MVCFGGGRRRRTAGVQTNYLIRQNTHFGRNAHETLDIETVAAPSRGNGRSGRRVPGSVVAMIAFAVDIGYMSVVAHATPGGGRFRRPGRRGQLEPVAKQHGGRRPAVRQRQPGRRQSRSNSTPATCSSARGTPLRGPLLAAARCGDRRESDGADRLRRRRRHVAVLRPDLRRQTSVNQQASAVAAVNPRDIAFVIDLSGSMNDDTSPGSSTQPVRA